MDMKSDSMPEYDAVKFGDKIVWSKAENAGDDVPDYVSKYIEAEMSGKGFGFTFDTDKNLIAIYPENGESMMWDLDGNVLEKFP